MRSGGDGPRGAGLSPDEFAAWLGTVLGWTTIPGEVECWEA
ncbi:MAG TPA: hypothetical protein VKG80_20640 [Trebonia sp.]|nr:hypothetical protein [Trebonia sp.]